MHLGAWFQFYTSRLVIPLILVYPHFGFKLCSELVLHIQVSYPCYAHVNTCVHDCVQVFFLLAFVYVKAGFFVHYMCMYMSIVLQSIRLEVTREEIGKALP